MAEWIDDGKSPIQVICHCDIVSEGADFPDAEVMVFARPTKSLRLYIQLICRIMRPALNKINGLLLDFAGVVYEHGLPTQDFDWKLDYGDKKTIKVAMKKTLEQRQKKTIICENCKFIYHGMLSCPLCHWKPKVAGKDVPTFEAYLEALDEIDHPKIDERSWYLQMRGYAKARGRTENSAFYRFQEKFGHKPSWSWRELPTLPCGLEVESWIRSRNIRWAKSKRNPGRGQENTQIQIARIASHGLGRKDSLGGNAYVREG